MSERPGTISQIGQIAIPVKSLDRAIAFYRDVLGLRLLFQAPPQMAFFACGSIRLLLGVAESGDDEHRSSLIYFRVGDIDKAWAELVSKGVEFTERPRMVAKMPDHELWLATFHDSEGNTLALMDEKR